MFNHQAQEAIRISDPDSNDRKLAVGSLERLQKGEWMCAPPWTGARERVRTGACGRSGHTAAPHSAAR